MAIGMTYEQYWYGDVHMVRAFYEANKLRQKQIAEKAWLYGFYTLLALRATVGNMFLKKGTQPNEYPVKPFEDETEQTEQPKTAEQEEQESIFALAYMSSMVQAGQSWGKKQ